MDGCTLPRLETVRVRGVVRRESSQVKALAQAAIDLTRFIHAARFKGIILSGRSSTVLALPLCRFAWEQLFPQSPFPRVFVFNEEGSSLLYKNLPEQQARKRTQLVREFIGIRLPELAALKDEPLCSVDDFLCTGEKYYALKDMFREQGFVRTNFAFLTGYDTRLMDCADFVAEDGGLMDFLYGLSRNLSAGPKTVAAVKSAIRRIVLKQTE
jgi:hypothetical protein